MNKFTTNMSYMCVYLQDQNIISLKRTITNV